MAVQSLQPSSFKCVETQMGSLFHICGASWPKQADLTFFKIGFIAFSNSRGYIEQVETNFIKKFQKLDFWRIFKVLESQNFKKIIIFRNRPVNQDFLSPRLPRGIAATNPPKIDRMLPDFHDPWLIL